jgi:general transcription factor 3C polypeptide 3 (transcription factor C subunit 4)
LEHFQLIGEVADAYLEKKEYQTALDLYQDISECEAVRPSLVRRSTLTQRQADLLLIWARIAECNRALGNFQVAVEYYEAVLNNKPDDHDVRLQLAEVYEDLGNRTKALELVNEGACAGCSDWSGLSSLFSYRSATSRPGKGTRSHGCNGGARGQRD